MEIFAYVSGWLKRTTRPVTMRDTASYILLRARAAMCLLNAILAEIFMSNDNLNRFLGDSPGRVILRLVVLSLVVGVILSTLNFSPLSLVYWVQDFFIRIWNMGFDALGRVGSYFVLGAIVVVPLWLISRLLNWRGR